MGAPDLEVGYTSTKTRRGENEVHKGYVVKKNLLVKQPLKIQLKKAGNAVSV
jgi:hypothetical protein